MGRGNRDRRDVAPNFFCKIAVKKKKREKERGESSATSSQSISEDREKGEEVGNEVQLDASPYFPR